MRTRTRRGALAAAIVVAAPLVPHRVGLSPHDRRLLAPVVGAAQTCLGELGHLSGALTFTIRHLADGLPPSMYLEGDATSAALSCAGGERFGVHLLQQRARTGRLSVVLARLSTLFRGGAQAARGSLELAGGASDVIIGDPAGLRVHQNQLAAAATGALAGLQMAQDAADALRPDLGTL